jgi:hypothetical protein
VNVIAKTSDFIVPYQQILRNSQSLGMLFKFSLEGNLLEIIENRKQQNSSFTVEVCCF